MTVRPMDKCTLVTCIQHSLQADEAREYIDEIIFYIRDQFVDGRTSTAKALVTDCVVVTQNRHCIAQLDKAVYGEIDTQGLAPLDQILSPLVKFCPPWDSINQTSPQPRTQRCNIV